MLERGLYLFVLEMCVLENCGLEWSEDFCNEKWLDEAQFGEDEAKARETEAEMVGAATSSGSGQADYQLAASKWERERDPILCFGAS